MLIDFIVFTAIAVVLGAVLVYLIGAAIWHAGARIIRQLKYPEGK